VEIRDVRPDEYDAAGEVVWAAYSEYAEPDSQGWIEYGQTLRDVAGRVDRTVVLVAVDGGRVLGSATIELDDVVGDDDPELPAGVSALRMLGVLPEARGRGIGRALVEAAVERARASGKRSLWLRTLPAMTTAQRMYGRMRFVRDESLDVAVDSDHLMGYRLELDPDSPAGPTPVQP